MLCWVLVAALGLSLDAVQGLLFVVVWAFIVVVSFVVEHAGSGDVGHVGWLPGPGIDPMSSALAGRLSTGSPLKPHAA